MEKLKDEYTLEIVWRSFELRPAGSPPIPEAYRERIAAMRPQMVTMAQERYGVEINSGPFGINSRPALIGAKYAEAQGRGAAYHAAIFSAYWQEARDIEDRQVLHDIAEAVGLEGEAFLAALADPQYEHQVNADIQQATDYGLSGVPALVFEGKYLVSGAQPYEVLRQVIERILTGNVE